MKVTGTRILVKQNMTAEISKGGIVMAGDQQALPYGEIMQVGPEVAGTIYCTGNLVLFNEIGAIPLGHIAKNHVLVEADDILAILEEGDLV